MILRLINQAINLIKEGDPVQWRRLNTETPCEIGYLLRLPPGLRRDAGQRQRHHRLQVSRLGMNKDRFSTEASCHTGSSNRPSRVMEPDESRAAWILGSSLALALETNAAPRNKPRRREYRCHWLAIETVRGFRSWHMPVASAPPERGVFETNDREAGHR